MAERDESLTGRMKEAVEKSPTAQRWRQRLRRCITRWADAIPRKRRGRMPLIAQSGQPRKVVLQAGGRA
jgi:hypothetical protein